MRGWLLILGFLQSANASAAFIPPRPLSMKEEQAARQYAWKHATTIVIGRSVALIGKQKAFGWAEEGMIYPQRVLRGKHRNSYRVVSYSPPYIYRITEQTHALFLMQGNAKGEFHLLRTEVQR